MRLDFPTTDYCLPFTNHPTIRCSLTAHTRASPSAPPSPHPPHPHHSSEVAAAAKSLTPRCERHWANLPPCIRTCPDNMASDAAAENASTHRYFPPTAHQGVDYVK